MFSEDRTSWQRMYSYDMRCNGRTWMFSSTGTCTSTCGISHGTPDPNLRLTTSSTMTNDRQIHTEWLVKDKWMVGECMTVTDVWTLNKWRAHNKRSTNVIWMIHMQILHDWSITHWWTDENSLNIHSPTHWPTTPQTDRPTDRTNHWLFNRMGVVDLFALKQKEWYLSKNQNYMRRGNGIDRYEPPPATNSRLMKMKLLWHM